MFTESSLYVVKAESGWRIERPSGSSVVRELDSKEDAANLLRSNGYEYQGLIGMNIWWMKSRRS